ncbi:MAG: hydroxyacid dehydrogenase [Opitutaceae bacterium]
MKGIFILDPDSFARIYPREIEREIGQLLDLVAPSQTAESIRAQPFLMQDVDIVLSGWGAPRLDEAFLDAAPRLKAFLYGAGSIRNTVTAAFWRRNIPIASAVSANAIPVAEYTLSQILFCLKAGWQHNRRCKTPGSDRVYGFDACKSIEPAGAFGSTVGLVSLGQVARRVIELLAPFEIRILAFDPFASADDARRLGIELCSLEDVFERSDVVSVHTPDLPETRGMISGDLVSRMRVNASLINTSRSAIVRHSELIQVLELRSDLWAILDVTEIVSDQEYRSLQTLSNVTLTPHIAGSMAGECARMGQYMLDDLKRFLKGEPLKYQITEQQAAIMA